MALARCELAGGSLAGFLALSLYMSELADNPSLRTTFQRESTGRIRLTVRARVLALQLAHLPPFPPPSIIAVILASTDRLG
ncbi:hypothetical protein PENSPDRAFT_649850 [Peniophora sp. CONT]|nr:hypothetical protein PENSPDRAFT_649850 [Peniophora sp. CONT]